jgi:hypothetical membrane protein
MARLGELLFFAGLVAAVVVALFFPNNNLIPWLVGGLGILVGFLNIRAAETRQFLIAGTALTVALISIQDQRYNPVWLTDVVFFLKVFITHVLLVVALIGFFKTAKD